MMRKIENEVIKLREELSDNAGYVPVQWQPCLTLIELFLNMVKPFTTGHVKDAINKILDAITIFEETKNK